MPDPSSPFLDTLLPVGTRNLAAHANAVTCVLAGRTGPLRLECDGRRIDGDLLLVRPGVVHAVALAERGAERASATPSPRPDWTVPAWTITEEELRKDLEHGRR
jgi:hypothetical protein